MATLAKEYGAKLVIMHMRGTPETMQTMCVYDDILKEITAFFEDKISLAARAGLPASDIILDPGLGFAKTKEQNWYLLENISYFSALRLPLLIGASRKSFTGKTLELSLKAAKMAMAAGADILRVHDVKETKARLGAKNA
jgi:dihydropteroate synthase